MNLGEDIERLLLRRLQGLVTSAENQRLEEWAAASAKNRAVLERLENEQALREDLGLLFSLVDTDEGDARLQRMEADIRQSVIGHPVRRLNRWVPYAAAVVFFAVTIAWLVMFNGPAVDRQLHLVEAENIQPGGNRAVLTLADGRAIVLDEAQRGIVVGDDHTTYDDGSELLGREDADKGTKGDVQYAILTTPRGGTYHVTLVDGTQVWLNAASSLRYPVAFKGSERVVEIVGEGYFVVAKDKDRPFKVFSRGQTIEVLGTEFNISAYPDEFEAKTTLVEGRVSVGFDESSTHHNYTPFTLLPGQQGIVATSSVRVEKVDVEQYTAWKDGFFYFNGDSPQEAFAQLSRWYDIELIYSGDVPTMQFYGKLERNMSLGSLLRILEGAGLEFEVTADRDGFQLFIGTEK